MSRTLALLTPDVVAADKASAIEELIQANSFAVLARLETTLSMQQAAEMFEEHEGKPFFSSLCQFMSSGPLIALALEKADAIGDWLKLMGPDCVATAKAEAPSSIRAVYGTDSIKKAAHGSASPAAAYRELKFFFPKTFPREATLTVVKSGEVSLIDKAAAEGFLVIAKKELTLTADQAAAFVAVDAFSVDEDEKAAKAAKLSEAGPLVAALLEKPFAVESWLSLPAGKSAVHSSLSPTAAASEAVALFGAAAVETIEYTFAFVTPDAFANAPSVLAVAEANGFTVMCSSSLTLSKEKAAAVNSDAAFVTHMTSGPVLAMVLQRPGAVTAWKALLGPADAKLAKESFPLSLRALFGTDAIKCAATGSESAAAAQTEAALFFPELAQTQTTLALLTPLPQMEAAMHEALTTAANAGLVVSNKVVTTLDEARATDFLALLGDAAPPPAPPPPPPTLFISAWVGGGVGQQVMQIFNPTDEAICLDGYALGVQPAKGSDPGVPMVTNFPPAKFVPANSVFCVHHESASGDLKAMLPADAAQTMSIPASNDGGDGMGLLKLTETGFEIVDLIGDFMLANKKQPWPVAGVARASKEKTLLRKATVSKGNGAPWTDPSKSSQGTCKETSEWVVLKGGTLELPSAGWTLASWSAVPSPPPPAAIGSFEAAVELLTSGPCVALALSGKGAVARWNALLGPEDPLVAKVRCATCLRARFGVDATQNVAHGSATSAAAFAEIKFFFPKTLVDPLPSNKEAQQYASERLVPTLTTGLVELCAVKPANPVEWLAQWLLENNPNTPKVYG